MGITYWLQIEFLSDTCFSGGVGFTGEVDIDIEQDENLGLPYIRGRTLKGLIVEESDSLLDLIKDYDTSVRWSQSAVNLFGTPGESEEQTLRISNAMLPAQFSDAVEQEIQNGTLTSRDILHSLTDIRHQTKINRETHAAEPHSLRATRLAIKELKLYAGIEYYRDLDMDEKALLSACALALQRGGLHRNRGLGKLRVCILDINYQDKTAEWATPLLNLYNQE